jgi:hypothetical protein
MRLMTGIWYIFIYYYKLKDRRETVHNKHPYFCGKDVCDILEQLGFKLTFGIV